MTTGGSEMMIGRSRLMYGGSGGITELAVGRGGRSFRGTEGGWLGCASRNCRFELEASRMGLSVSIRYVATGGIDGVG